jgi:hypothetical protein
VTLTAKQVFDALDAIDSLLPPFAVALFLFAGLVCVAFSVGDWLMMTWEDIANAREMRRLKR